MPIREYICKDCGEEFEYFQVRSDDTSKCPKCKSKDLEQKVSTNTGFSLKGKGWYKDGYQ